jgi:hypothetical protein
VELVPYSAQESAWQLIALELLIHVTQDAIPAQSETTRFSYATSSQLATLKFKARSSDAILPAGPAVIVQQPAWAASQELLFTEELVSHAQILMLFPARQPIALFRWAARVDTLHISTLQLPHRLASAQLALKTATNATSMVLETATQDSAIPDSCSKLV